MGVCVSVSLKRVLCVGVTMAAACAIGSGENAHEPPHAPAPAPAGRN